jgi:hypothetical protein
MTTPTTPTSTTVAISEYTAASIGELLTMCEEFLRTAGPATHCELRSYLRDQNPPTDPGWLIDMLGFTAVHLAHQLKARTPTQARPPHRSPRDAWQEATQ